MFNFPNLFNLRRFFAIIKKEFIQVRRDPISLRIPIAMPIVMMFLFGYAVNTEVEHIKTAVLDMSKSVQSREYAKRFVVSDYFDIVAYADSEAELESLVETGAVKAGLIIPSDYSQKLISGHVPDTRLVIDGTDPTTARTALSSGILINEMYSKTLREGKMQIMGIKPPGLPGVTLNAKVWYNPNLKSTRFTIPGLVGLILQNITVMLTAFALVREKEKGTIEQLIVTPIRPVELILGKLVPYIIIGYVAFLFALGICVFWFNVSIEGSVMLLLALGFLFVLCSLAIGMLISTFARNQLQAMMAMVLFLLPSILLSGFIFPREAMPWFISIIGNVIPLTYFLDIIRGIVLKGVGIEILMQSVVALTVFFCMILGIAVIRFRKNLE